MKNKSSGIDLAKSAWLVCHRACNLIARCEEALFARAGISPQQFGVLYAINEIEEPVTVSKIADFIERDRNTISMIVDRMEKAGLVERTRDLNDRRSVRIVATKKGKSLFQHSLNDQIALISRLAVAFQDGELEVAIRLLENMRESALAELSRKKQK
ncbi:MarR family winged helix-turn-helix transcriptional regulator [Chloroflexota bacterium]